MTTKLEAVNTMLSCIGYPPINTLSGTQSAFVVAAIALLDTETKRVQLQEWDFNTEEDYPLNPDTDGYIHVPQNVVRIKVPYEYRNQYIVRNGKIYDKINHTFIIDHGLRVRILFALTFDELPEVAKDYVKMCAAYKFTKRELGSQAICIYTQEDLVEAKQAMEEAELDTGNYSLIPELYTGEIRGEL